MRAGPAGVLLVALLAGAACAQQPAVIGVENYIHAVNDLDASVKFYKEVFGFELSSPPADVSNPAIPALLNAPGAKLRAARFKLPGESFELELGQFSGVKRLGKWPAPSDPGAAELELKVPDMNAVFANLVSKDARIITRSGQPVKITTDQGKSRGLLVRDPDGYILNVMETPAAAAAPPAGLVHSVQMGLIAEDLDKTKAFYHDMLGFDFSPATEWSGSKTILDMIGTINNGVLYREMTAKVPGTSPGAAAEIDFYEYKNVPRWTFHLHPYDPGSPAISLRVKDLEGLVKRLKANGTPIVSAKGEIVQFDKTTRNIVVTDPNGLNLDLYETKQ